MNTEIERLVPKMAPGAALYVADEDLRVIYANDEWRRFALGNEGMELAGPAWNTNLLDNMLIWYSSEIADGNSHAHNGMPILLIGKGGGEIASGRHIVYGAPQPQGNLFISMLKTVGVDVTGFGDDGTGELEGLTG